MEGERKNLQFSSASCTHGEADRCNIRRCFVAACLGSHVFAPATHALAATGLEEKNLWQVRGGGSLPTGPWGPPLEAGQDPGGEWKIK